MSHLINSEHCPIKPSRGSTVGQMRVVPVLLTKVPLNSEASLALCEILFYFCFRKIGNLDCKRAKYTRQNCYSFVMHVCKFINAVSSRYKK